jgi:hypothetical protein
MVAMLSGAASGNVYRMSNPPTKGSAVNGADDIEGQSSGRHDGLDGCQSAVTLSVLTSARCAIRFHSTSADALRCSNF